MKSFVACKICNRNLIDIPELWHDRENKICICCNHFGQDNISFKKEVDEYGLENFFEFPCKDKACPINDYKNCQYIQPLDVEIQALKAKDKKSKAYDENDLEYDYNMNVCYKCRGTVNQNRYDTYEVKVSDVIYENGVYKTKSTNKMKVRLCNKCSCEFKKFMKIKELQYVKQDS